MADDFHEMDLRVTEAPSILDMGVLLAENAWMLIGSALAGAVLAFLLALLLPRTYESTSLLKFTEADAAVIRSADVLMPVIKELNLLRDDPLDVALEKLNRKVSPVFRKKDAALQVSTRAETQEAEVFHGVCNGVVVAQLQQRGELFGVQFTFALVHILRQHKVDKRLLPVGEFRARFGRGFCRALNAGLGRAGRLFFSLP
jgi:hypothetical protein